jgi:hypothetical protein
VLTQVRNMTQIDQGYSIFDRVFARAEMMRVLETLTAATVERTRAGARHVLNVPVIREHWMTACAA